MESKEKISNMQLIAKRYIEEKIRLNNYENTTLPVHSAAADGCPGFG